MTEPVGWPRRQGGVQVGGPCGPATLQLRILTRRAHTRIAKESHRAILAQKVLEVPSCDGLRQDILLRHGGPSRAAAQILRVRGRGDVSRSFRFLGQPARAIGVRSTRVRRRSVGSELGLLTSYLAHRGKGQ